VFEPLVSEELIARLESSFPLTPTSSMSHRELDQLIGRQQVIAYLKRLHEDGELQPDGFPVVEE